MRAESRPRDRVQRPSQNLARSHWRDHAMRDGTEAAQRASRRECRRPRGIRVNQREIRYRKFISGIPVFPSRYEIGAGLISRIVAVCIALKSATNRPASEGVEQLIGAWYYYIYHYINIPICSFYYNKVVRKYVIKSTKSYKFIYDMYWLVELGINKIPKNMTHQEYNINVTF